MLSHPSIPGSSFVSLPELGFELPALFSGVGAPFPWILLSMEGSGAIRLLWHQRWATPKCVLGDNDLIQAMSWGNFFTTWAALEEGFGAGIDP